MRWGEGERGGGGGGGGREGGRKRAITHLRDCSLSASLLSVWFSRVSDCGYHGTQASILTAIDIYAATVSCGCVRV